MKKSVAGIALKKIDGKYKILVAKRNPSGQMGSRWEFPGGKVENDESDETTLCREYMEEFSVGARAVKMIAQAEFEHNDDKVQLDAWEIQLEHDGLEKKYVLTEHTEYMWVYPEEIASLNFVDSDLLLYPEVLKYVRDLDK